MHLRAGGAGVDQSVQKIEPIENKSRQKIASN
jgi:hypothetical protein